jgi:hypothetical protein
MSDFADTPADKAEHALDDADKLCAELKAQIARARKLVRDARATLDPQNKASGLLTRSGGERP